MANNDSIIGGIMAIIGIVGIVLELWYLIIDPLRSETPFAAAQYWAIVIPLFLGVAGILVIVLWIGVTMIQTPPPEAWDFDDLEDELDDDSEDDSISESTKSSTSSIDGLDGVTATNAKTLADAGFDTVDKIAAASVADLTTLKGIGKTTATKIVNSAKGS